ncbi:MAG: amino acid ABC transporter permease [Deltaproteobacteria bacterium]|nr:amino acid ABC transporter permease [Deltaproteobacteria bacterium]MBW2138275.1 amino acid ABC transporter permease [Deltaproteobacteria bacterium]
MGRNVLRFLRASIIGDLVRFFLLLAAITWLIARGTDVLGYNWQWYRVPGYIFTYGSDGFRAGPLLQGLVVTFKITGLSLILAMVFGLVTALFRLSQSFAASALARIYMEVTRNTPLLVQLFFIYFVMGPVLGISRFFSAVLALSLFEGAYASEIFRAGIVSIQKGQWEAAYSLGLSGYSTYRYIILPQALRRVLPPLTGQAISLVKDSALVSTIAVYDLTMRGQEIIADTYLAFEIWFAVAGIYLIITVALSICVALMERRLSIAA